MKSKEDGKKRCAWIADPLMQRYHDREWGVPVRKDRKHFEFLVLESAQAGLSWRTVLNKRENYRKAFAGFDAAKVEKFGKSKIRELLQNPGIIRNRLKIEAAVNNARRFLKIRGQSPKKGDRSNCIIFLWRKNSALIGKANWRWQAVGRPFPSIARSANENRS